MSQHHKETTVTRVANDDSILGIKKYEALRHGLQGIGELLARPFCRLAHGNKLEFGKFAPRNITDGSNQPDRPTIFSAHTPRAIGHPEIIAGAPTDPVLAIQSFGLTLEVLRNRPFVGREIIGVDVLCPLVACEFHDAEDRFQPVR